VNAERPSAVGASEEGFHCSEPYPCSHDRAVATPCAGARDERCHPDPGMCACFDTPEVGASKPEPVRTEGGVPHPEALIRDALSRLMIPDYEASAALDVLVERLEQAALCEIMTVGTLTDAKEIAREALGVPPPPQDSGGGRAARSEDDMDIGTCQSCGRYLDRMVYRDCPSCGGYVG
jgi:hypothetical protein